MLAVALAFYACAAASAQKTDKPEAAHPFLWKIEGAGRKTSWLFGTIHLSRPDVTDLPPSVLEAVDHADAVYTEIPVDAPTMLALVPKMMLPNGATVDSLLGAKLTQQLVDEVKAIRPDFTLEPFARFKPWAVIASVLQLEDQMKYPGAVALDMLIFQRAAMAGKEVGGIETPDEQIAAFDAFTDAEQVLMVEDTIKQLREQRGSKQSFSDLLTNLYLAGDLDNLVYELTKMDSIDDNPELSAKFMDRLLYQRNDLMAGRITKRLREHPDTSYLFAVGAAHLQGDRGLIADLKKAGFQLTRVQ